MNSSTNSDPSGGGDDRAERHQPRAEPKGSFRGLAIAAAIAALAIASVLFAIKYFAAGQLPELTEAALDAAIKRWDENGPKNYDMDIELRGAQPGKVHVEVRDGEVAAETRDGRVPNQSTWYVWSVPGMFDTVERDLQIAANPQQVIEAPQGAKWWLRCEFDPRYGYPAVYHRAVTQGPEVFWRVTSFVVK